MAAAAIDPQDVLQARPQAAGVLPRHTKVRRHTVRLLKFHPDLLAAESVRVTFQHIGGIGAPAPPGFYRRRGRQPQGSQQAHHAADAELPLVFLPYFSGVFSRDAPHLSQPFRFLFYDGEGIITEACHNAPRQRRPDPLDRPGGQIFADGPGGGGQGALDELRAELHSVGAVHLIAASRGNFFPLGDLRHLAHHCHRVTVHIHQQHGKAAFFVVVGHILHRPGDLFQLLFHCFAAHRPFLLVCANPLLAAKIGAGCVAAP